MRRSRHRGAATAETFGTDTLASGVRVLARTWRIQFVSGMHHSPIGAPHVGAIWIAHADPRCGKTKLVPLADGKRLARPVGDMLDGNLAVAKKHSGVVATWLIDDPLAASSPGTLASRIDQALRRDVVRCRWLEHFRGVNAIEMAVHTGGPCRHVRRRGRANRESAAACYPTGSETRQTAFAKVQVPPSCRL